MKVRFVFIAASILLIGVFALGRPQSSGTKPDLPAQGQALVDGMLNYADDGSGKLTLEGPAARALFLKMSDERVTSKEPTDECQPAVIKSGDNLECGHCEVHGKRKKDDFNYWCVLNVETEFGKILPNTTISAPQAQPQQQPQTQPKSK